MKRHRVNSGTTDAHESFLFGSTKKVAVEGLEAQLEASGIGSPQAALTRLEEPFSPRHSIQRPSAPLPIQVGHNEDYENRASVLSYSPQSFKLPVCGTPEEQKSPQLRSPPPRPHKFSPSGCSSPALAHPQPRLKHVPLQELVTRIRLRPGALRRIASSTVQRAPSRPKPRLNRHQTTSNLSQSRDSRSLTTEDQEWRGQREEQQQMDEDCCLEETHDRRPVGVHGRDEGQEDPRMNVEVEKKACYESLAKQDVSIDPNLGAGMFHRATLSRLYVRGEDDSKARQGGNRAEEWVEGRRYNPYELVQNARRSPSPSSAQNASPADRSPKHNSRTINTPPFRVPDSTAAHRAVRSPINKTTLSDAAPNIPRHFIESDCVEESGAMEYESSEFALPPNAEQERLLLRSVRSPSIGTTRRFQALRATSIEEVSRFSPMDATDAAEESPREQIFDMEFSHSSPPLRGPSILHEPGPSAW